MWPESSIPLRAVNIAGSALVAIALLVGCGAQGSVHSHSRDRSSTNQAASTQCPAAATLNSLVTLPSGWKLEPRNPLEDPDHVLPTGAILPQYKLGCAYRSNDENSFLTLVFAVYSTDSAPELYTEMRQAERGCSPTSLCDQEQINNGDEVVAESDASFVAANVQYLETGEAGEYTADIAGAAQNGPDLCLLPLKLPQRIETTDSDATPGGNLDGLDDFLRTACQLPPGSTVADAAEGEPTSTSAAAVATGRTHDKTGARATFLAYTEAIDDHDFPQACSLLTETFKERHGGDAGCPHALASVFGSFEPSPSQKAHYASLAAHASVVITENGTDATVSTEENVTDLLWTGEEWLMNPQ